MHSEDRFSSIANFQFYLGLTRVLLFPVDRLPTRRRSDYGKRLHACTDVIYVLLAGYLYSGLINTIPTHRISSEWRNPSTQSRKQICR
ncbi:hypothetical protein F5B18DRAFT_403840 [Nemania serpens]|nr:hypothetical protein F5B18DRAFT_403840 [Nemania serpens]